MKHCRVINISLLVLLLFATFFAYGETRLKLRTYGHHMDFLPGVEEIYTDSIYIEHLNVYRSFDPYVYAERFDTFGREAMRDESLYFYNAILFFLRDPEAIALLDLLDKEAVRLKNQDLVRELEFLRVAYTTRNSGTPLERVIGERQRLIDKAIKRGDTEYKLRVMTELIDRLWVEATPDYSKFFKHALLLAGELEKPSAENFYDKGNAYYLIGNGYYYFRDYDKAIPYLKKALKDDVTCFYDRSNLRSLNTLAVCYQEKGLLDVSMFYLFKMLESEDRVEMRPMYDVIAIANIGYCYQDLEQYEEAIECLKEALPGAKRKEDHSFVTGIYIGLGENYLGIGDQTNAKAMIDSARWYLNTYNHISSRYRKFYHLLSKYYIRLGEKEEAVIYMDSTMNEHKKYIEKYNALNILRAEQELFETEKEIHRNRIRWQQHTLTLSVIILFITFGMLWLLYRIYRKKRKAYQRLMHTTQKWFSEDLRKKTEDSPEVNKEDLLLLKRINDLMDHERIFLQPGFTSGTLAEHLGIPDSLVLKVVADVQGTDFQSYVDGYRVQEAIRILSDPLNKQVSMEEVIDRCGFTDRQSFDRIFESETGMTPRQFRRIQLEIDE